ncbi:MAG: ATP-binding protein [Acidobacteria bacterium]|nr:ATP-binding protein [Acidobacteriota bacterium]
MKQFCRFLIFGLIASQSLFSQAPLIKFDHISLEQGLSQSIIECIIQDSQGFMWFGTEDGLNKYDGYNFTVIRQIPNNLNSLSHNYILSIYEDKMGITWIGTFHGGLNKFDAKTGKYTHYLRKQGEPNSLSNNVVRSICEDRKGMLWIATDDGLNCFNKKTDEFIVYRHDDNSNGSISNNNVLIAFEDNSGMIWAGTNGGGLNRFNRENGSFKTFKNDPKDPFSLPNNIINTIYEDRSGELWIGTEGGGLAKFDKKNGSFISYKNEINNPSSLSNNIVRAIYEDKNEILWIGTYGGGLNRFDRKTGSFYSYQNDPINSSSISNNSIFSIYEDRSGVFWVGTYGGGINKFDGKKKKFMHYYVRPNTTNSLSDSIVWSFFEDKEGFLWVGTQQGLDRFDRKNNHYTHYRANANHPDSLSHDIVRQVYEDHSGIFWLGTNGGGVNVFDKQKGTFKVYRNDPANPRSLSHNEIRCIYEDRNGIIWIGTNGGGLNKFNRVTNDFTRYCYAENKPGSLSNNFVRCFYEDHYGNFWIGTQGGGLNKFDRQKEIFTHYKYNPHDKKSLSNDFVFCLIEDHSGVLWIGTWGGGINRFNTETGSFSLLGTNEGLPSNSIYGILEDNEGNLWISSTRGLTKYNPKDHSIKNYTERDGLQSDEFNGGAYYKNTNGEMFFGGINGFNAFYPSEIKDKDYKAPIVITAFKKLNKDVQLDKPISELNELILSPKDYFFSFEFAALDYAAPQKNRYAYKMEGLDNDWIATDAAKRFASYTTLSPGKYRFRVKGSNNDGVWNEEGVAITIIITPPLYKTWWFQALVGILLILLLLYIHEVRTDRIRQELEKIRLEKELQLKADFTAMLVHDLRSPLTTVMGYSDMLINQADKMDVPKVGNVITRASRKMLNLINDMLDFAKFEAGKMTLNKKYVSIAPIILDIAEIMPPLLNQKKINLLCEIEPGLKKKQLPVDPEKIGQVLSNLLSNAEKFTPQNGMITIHAFEVPGIGTGQGFLEVTVTDNGPGVPPELQKYLFDKYAQLSEDQKLKGTGLGLAVSRLIVEAHGGTIGYRQINTTKGSVFYFRLPLK